jgi:type I restriction enzyme S subunit
MTWPDGWREEWLLNICELNPKLSAEERPSHDTQVTFVPMSAIDESSGTIAQPETREYSEVAKGYTPFREGDVLFAKVTPCMENGKAAIARGLTGGLGFGSTEFHVLRPGPEIVPEYLFHFIRQTRFRELAAAAFVGTGGLQRVPPDFFRRVKLGLPPVPEQLRITEILRQVHSILEAKGIASEFSDRLIAAHYRQLFARYFTADGLTAPVRIGEYIESAQYGISEALAEDGTHAVLRMSNISNAGWLDLNDLKYATISPRDVLSTELRDGDLLFNRTNSRELVGKCAIWREASGTFSFASYLVRLRLKTGLVPEFLWGTLNSAYGKYRLLNAAKQAVSMANVSPTDLARITIPLPPLEEQERFADFVRDIEVVRKQILDARNEFTRFGPRLIGEALSGRLTADWRRRHAGDRDSPVEQPGAALPSSVRKLNVQFTEYGPQEPKTGFARPRRQALIDQLSEFQHEVWNTLRHEWRRSVLADDPVAFEDFCTSPNNWRLEGRGMASAEVRRALEQLAAMGLVRKMTLPVDNPSTGSTDFVTAFRALHEDEHGGRAEEDAALEDTDRVRQELARREREAR